MPTEPLIFLAEDDPDDQQFFLEAALSLQMGIQVVIASRGDLAVQNVSEMDMPNLIFLDLNMPVLNGLECLKAIRGKKNLSQIPVYIYTTYCSPKHKEEAQKLGVTSVVIKPDSIKELSLTLKNILLKVLN